MFGDDVIKNECGQSGATGLYNWLYLSKEVKSYLKNLGKLKITLIIFWVVLVKIGHGTLLGHGT